jgi:hypothetical protein
LDMPEWRYQRWVNHHYQGSEEGSCRITNHKARSGKSTGETFPSRS